MNSFTQSNSNTFTLTHAKYLASKVATDLKRIQRFYGSPSDNLINAYESELIELLKNGYLDSITYGFKRNDNWIEPTIKYTARELNVFGSSDDDPGKIRPGANVINAGFTSYLIYSPVYLQLNAEQQQTFEKSLPFQRSVGTQPSVSGYWSNDNMYSSGSRALDRSSVKSY